MVKWGRSSFKMGNWIAIGRHDVAERWIEHNQRLFNRDEVWFRVLKENSGWDPVPAGEGMFGAPPRDPGIWDVPWLKGYWDKREKEPHRVRADHITAMNRRVTEWFFKQSAETGCGFELVIIATLKHIDKVGNGHIDHIIRQELVMFDELKKRYPNAKIIASACNEWDAHHHREDPWDRRESFTLRMVNMWAVRRSRDGYGFLPFIVDHGGRDTFEYQVGPGRESYDWGMLHPERSGRWWEAPPTRPIKEACHGQPYGATESMYYVQHEDRERAASWYRNPAGWQTDVEKQMMLYDSLARTGFTYIIVHDEKGVQSSTLWPRAETTLEARLREKFGGTQMKFKRIIDLAYRQVLDRRPDPGGLEHYNEHMHSGMTEAELREVLLRSPEYAAKNPEGED